MTRHEGGEGWERARHPGWQGGEGSGEGHDRSPKGGK